MYLKRISRGRLLTTILVAGLLALILSYYLLYGVNRGAAEENNINNKLAELFVKSMIYLNYTRNGGWDTYSGVSHYVSISDNIDELIREYGEFKKYYFYSTVFNQSMPTLMRKLWTAYINYYYAANASKTFDEIDQRLDKLMPLIERSLKSLKDCDIDTALRIYNNTRSDVLDTINLIDNTLDKLVRINKSALLNDKHREIVKQSINTLYKIEDGLTKYINVMDAIKQAPEFYMRLCRAAHGQGSLDKGSESMAKNILNIIKNPQMGQATDEAEALKIMIENALNQHGSSSGPQGSQNQQGGGGSQGSQGSQNQQGQGGNQSGGQQGSQQNSGQGGQSAGYYNYTRTD